MLGLARFNASRRTTSRSYLASRSLRATRSAGANAVMVTFFGEQGSALFGVRSFTSGNETPASFVAGSLVTSGVAMTLRALSLVGLSGDDSSLQNLSLPLITDLWVINKRQTSLDGFH